LHTTIPVTAVYHLWVLPQQSAQMLERLFPAFISPTWSVQGIITSSVCGSICQLRAASVWTASSKIFHPGLCVSDTFPLPDLITFLSGSRELSSQCISSCSLPVCAIPCVLRWGGNKLRMPSMPREPFVIGGRSTRVSTANKISIKQFHLFHKPGFKCRVT
jgi:hypothetical protein